MNGQIASIQPTSESENYFVNNESGTDELHAIECGQFFFTAYQLSGFLFFFLKISGNYLKYEQSKHGNPRWIFFWWFFSFFLILSNFPFQILLLLLILSCICWKFELLQRKMPFKYEKLVSNAFETASKDSEFIYHQEYLWRLYGASLYTSWWFKNSTPSLDVQSTAECEDVQSTTML